MECRIQQHGNATEIEGKLPVKRLEIDSVSPFINIYSLSIRQYFSPFFIGTGHIPHFHVVSRDLSYLF